MIKLDARSISGMTAALENRNAAYLLSNASNSCGIDGFDQRAPHRFGDLGADRPALRPSAITLATTSSIRVDRAPGRGRS